MTVFRHLFIIDPLAHLNMDLDSSLRLVRSLLAAGDEVYFADAAQLSWRHGKDGPGVKAAAFMPAADVRQLKGGERKHYPLQDFHAIHMRKDPPYDLDYIAILWQLDAVADRVRVYNEPRGLLQINEKLGILRYPQYIAPALVSSSPQELLDFIKGDCRGDAVIKPLTLYGGKGIERIEMARVTESGALAQLETLTESGKAIRLVQPFNPLVYQGEVRAFLFGDQPIGWCLKKPADKQFLANSNFGSTRHPYTPSAAEIEMVTIVAKDLRDHYGIFMIGFDLIGGQLSEINVTSPRLLHPDDDRSPYYDHIAKLIHQDLQTFHS